MGEAGGLALLGGGMWCAILCTFTPKEIPRGFGVSVHEILALDCHPVHTYLGTR